MSKIWANRLIAGTKFWNQVPSFRKLEVKLVLDGMVENNKITPQEYEDIVGEPYKTQ